MWGGRLTFEAPMLWAIGFLYLFLLGGITGIIVASPALDFHLQDTYFVVAHFHNTLVGGSVFAVFAALYYWFPKMSGRRLSEPLGRIHFALFVVGFTLTFIPQYALGMMGMTRRIADYAATNDWTQLNQLSTIARRSSASASFRSCWPWSWPCASPPRSRPIRGGRHARVVDRLAAAARELP